jgi:hypothetical protein
MSRRSIVVEGPLAFRTARIAAAQRADSGLQIFTLPLLAARLAGGFNRPARSQDLDPAIRAALAAGGLTELEGIRQLPGTTRSIARTLAKVWQADLDLEGSLATMLGLPSLRRSSAAFAPTSQQGF